MDIDFRVLKLNSLDNGKLFNDTAADIILKTWEEKKFLSMYGELEPSFSNVLDTTLVKASHLIKNVYLKDGYLFCKIKILSTYWGKCLKKYIQDNFGYEFPDNLLKSINRDNQINSILNEDYNVVKYPEIYEILELVGIKVFTRSLGYINNNIVNIEKFYTFDIYLSNGNHQIYRKRDN